MAQKKVPEWLSYRNSRKVTQNSHFLKKSKGGTNENFSKIAQKVALASKAKSTLAQMALSSNMYALIVQRLEKILAKFFKVRPENSPHLKGQTALWPKWNYPLISLQVKVQRLEKIVAQEKAPKVPERPRYGNF